MGKFEGTNLLGVIDVHQEMIALAANLILENYAERKLTVDDVTEPLQVATEMWLYGLTHQNFEFLDDLARRTRRGRDQSRRPFGTILTHAQVKGALNCWRADLLRESGAAEVDTELDLSVLPVGTRGSGYFAAYDSHEGKLRFFRVDKPENERWAGWVFVKEQLGGNFTKLGSQRPGHSYKGAGAGVLEQVVEQPLEAAQLYGQEIGQCGICNTKLTDETSRQLGIGPECRKKVGL